MSQNNDGPKHWQPKREKNVDKTKYVPAYMSTTDMLSFIFIVL